MEKVIDLVIRGGLVVDGGGGEPFIADVGVDDGLIVAVGAVGAKGREEIDAAGKIVTPGFVDIHTHYDGQVSWDHRIKPSSSHGISTIVMGNCGVGFAPCRSDQHDLLISLMEGVEDIPNPVLVEGLPWTWESFPEYLDMIAGRDYDVNIAAYLPHAALRVYVMGQRGVDREPATEADLKQMKLLMEEALDVGALGFGTSRTLFHRSSDGKEIPTFEVAEDDLQTLADALAERRQGIIQMVSDFHDIEGDIALMRRLGKRSGRTVTFSMGEGEPSKPSHWRQLLQLTRAASDDGVILRPQILGRPVGMLLGHELTLNPFSTVAAYKALAGLPIEEKFAALADPQVRASIIAGDAHDDPTNKLATLVRGFGRTFEFESVPDYEPSPDRSVLARAQVAGVTPEEMAYDLMMQDGGRTKLYVALGAYRTGSLDPTFEMLQHPDIIFGLGDGGAHCATICDGSYSTFALTHWARDRTRGERLPLALVVKKLSRETAETVGLLDRGLVREGYRADLNVIDFEGLTLYGPELVYDLPAGGKRLLQRADDYVANIVNGEVVYRDGKATGALPGRLVRGAQPEPAIA